MKLPTMHELAGHHVSDTGSRKGSGKWTCPCGEPFTWTTKLHKAIPYSEKEKARETVAFLATVLDAIRRHMFAKHGAAS